MCSSDLYLRAVRGELSVAPRLRELAMCAVATLNGAEYEYLHHAPEFVAAGGTPSQAEALRQPDAALAGPLFPEPDRAVLELTIAMTREVAVPDALFARVLASLGERAAVEIVAVIATYNMVSRFLVALGVTPED